MRLTGTSTSHHNARRLRRAMTPPKIALWQALRRDAHGLRFRRQHPAGEYVLDFYSAPARLAIKIDGEAHSRGDRPARDAARNEWLRRQGVRVLRFTATNVLSQLEAVVRQTIAVAAERIALPESEPPPSPSVIPRVPPPLAGENE